MRPALVSASGIATGEIPGASSNKERWERGWSLFVISIICPQESNWPL